jgi:predicted O-methyltransferase YrrM
LTDLVVDVAPVKTNDPQPAVEMLCVRQEAAAHQRAVAFRRQTLVVGGEMRRELAKIVCDGDQAAILKEAHEAPDAADVVAAGELTGAVASAATAMSSETRDDGRIDACDRDPAVGEPAQKVVRRTCMACLLVAAA